MHELPFYEKLSIAKHLKDIQEVIQLKILDSKDPLAQSETSKSSIKDVLKDHLDVMEEFKY